MTAIRKEMGITEIVEQFPQAVPVLMQFGMGCIGCAAARFESLEQGASAHGIDVDALVLAMNEAVAQ